MNAPHEAAKSPFAPNVRDLDRAFHAASLSRGREYALSGRVRGLEVQPQGANSTELRAQVRGSARAPYRVSVTLSRRSAGGPVEIDSRCTCPVGSLCKHAAAVLLRWRPQLAASGGSPLAAPAPLGRMWIPPAAPADATPPPLRLDWVEKLRRIGQTADGAADPKRRRLVYRLHTFPYDHRLHVEPRIVYALKDGRLGRTEAAPADLLRVLSEPAPYVWAADEPLLRALLGLQSHAMVRAFSLEHAPARLLEEIIATGRCLAEDDANRPLRAGPERAGRPVWITNDAGQQSFTLEVEPAAPVLAAPLPVYLDAEQRLIGAVTTDFDPRAAAVLLLAPAVAPDDAPQVAEALAEAWPSVAPAVPAPLPTVMRHRIAHGAGVVCVRLAAAGAQPDVVLSRHEPATPPAALFAALRIDGVRVPLQRAESNLVVGSEIIDAAPDPHQVGQVLRQFDEAGLAPWTQPPMPRARHASESAFVVSDHAALALVEDFLPRWRQQGWEVTIEHDFPWQLVAVDDFEMSFAGVSNDWFELQLGVKIGEERVPLLPILDSALADPQLRRWAAEDRLGAKDHQLQVRIDARRVVRLPWRRLAPIVETLIELNDDKRPRRDKTRLRLSRFDAARVAALADSGAATWRGAPDLREFARKLADFREIDAVPAPVTLHAQLRPYQQAGLNWLQFLRQFGLPGLLADDMGLGKTVQTLAHLALEKEQGRLTTPALIVAPTSLVHNWLAEAARFTPELRTLKLHGAARHQEFDRIDGCDVVVTSFALLPRDIEQLALRQFHILVVDEAQNIKNARTQAAAAVRRIRAPHRLALTGTPLENHLGELWAQFDWLAPGLLGDSASFTRQYRTPIEKRADATRRAHLSARIRPFVLRRTKEQVAPELPPRTEIERGVDLEGGQRDLYETVRASMEDKVRRALAQQGLARSQIVVLDALLKLRQVCCDPRLVQLAAARRVKESAKLDLLFDLLDSLLAEGRRILVFSQFTSMLALIEQRLHERKLDYALLTGDTRDRAGEVERFQRGDVPLFLLSLKAGGTGLNLTAADTVIHYDPWWNPAVEQQATDRAHRIGQDKPVFVYRLICAGTVEERMRSLQARKAQLADAMLGDEAELARALSLEDVESLLAPVA